MTLKSLLPLLVFSLLLPSFSHAGDRIEGRHCYTCGKHESLDEGRLLTRTLAIGNAIESHPLFLKYRAHMKNALLKHEIIKIVSSGYLRDLKVVEHREEGRTICETVEAQLAPEALGALIEREVGKRNREAETLGVDNNGCLKILRAMGRERDRYGYRIKIILKVLKKTGSLDSAREQNKKPCFKVGVDFFDDSGTPIGGDAGFIHESDVGMLPGEMKTLTFYTSPEVTSYRVWLPGTSKRPKPGTGKPSGKTGLPSPGPRKEGSGEVKKLEGIETTDLGDKIQVVFFAAGPIQKYKKFFMDRPPRLVVDLPGNWKGPRESRIKADNDIVKKIRIGNHPDKLRVVLDLGDKERPFLTDIQESPQGITITIQKRTLQNPVP